MANLTFIGIGLMCIVIGFFISGSFSSVMTALGFAATSFENLIVTWFVVIVGVILLGFGFIGSDTYG